MKNFSFSKFVSMSLCVCLLCSLCSIYSFAADINYNTATKNISVKNATPQISEEKLYSYMLDLGYSIDEANFLLTLSQTTTITKNSWVFPPNPDIGDTFERTFFVSKATITGFGKSAAAIAAGLVLEGVAVGVAVLAASTVIDLIADNTDFEGIEFTTHYVYGTTNEGGLDWNTGATTWEIIY